MWNRLAPYVLRFLDMWSRLALYVLRLLRAHDPNSGPENEVGGNINLCYQMVHEEADPTTATCSDYDVFLSFRGPDTRHGFTDCLYEFMRQAGIRVYRDNEELQPGEKISEILRAVKSSKIFIPIFSQNYASSRWCLEELACMVESTRQSAGKKILPIFYDVDPSDVKLETRMYKSALNKHEEKYGCTLVKPWKEALTTVARLKGWHLKDQRHGQAMTDITQKVLRKITTTKRNLPINLVGIDDRIEDIKKLLDCQDTSDVRFVIIYGISGIGKTTLANAVFNQISPQFEGHSFLSNIQESSSYGGIEKMQRKLVADLFGYPFPETFDFDNGNNIIRERLPNRRVLIVFDGMDKKDQFMQLAKHCTSCRPGSRIIITTRDKSIFPVTKVEGLEENISIGSRKFFLYEMKEMHFDDALQLFNKLAFNTDSAPSDLHDLSREVVELSGGLPLVVEVMGSHLGSQRKADRRSTLENLKEVPREEVQQKLKTSYDALDCWAQQIYLDIACFFANKKITNPMYMWKDCGFSPKDKIDVLINKSLIKIVDHDRIWMHDQLRALGREIICQESIKKPKDRSRLWFLDNAPKMGRENAVALTRRRSGHNFTRKDFVNLTNARFLILEGGNFAGNFEDVLPDLRLLYWQNCPPKLQANNFVLNHLVVLKLSGDITTEEWSGWVKIMVASKLKVLKIAGSKSLMRTPCFSELLSLERLVLKDFPKLAQIDCSIGRLERLIYLKIKWCPRLRGLPEQIGFLTELRELILIQGFSVCYLPDSIGNLRLLSRLVMEDTGVVELPDTIKGLANLKCFCLANCTSLNSLPDDIGELMSLTELDLSGTTIKELPHSLWNLQDLTLRINSSTIRTRLMTDLPLLEGIEDCLDPLRHKDKAGSETALKKLNEVSLKKARQKIILSYEALDYGAKQNFLYIAFCFDYNKKTTVENVWKAPEIFPKVEIDVLVDKSLIKIVDNRIRMHDLVRDCGRKIIGLENIERPKDKSRLWFLNMVPERVRTVEGIVNEVPLALWGLRHNLRREDFVNFMNLWSFKLNGGNFPSKANRELNHSIVLKLSSDMTTEEWSIWVEIMVTIKLKVLYITGSKSSTKTFHFSEFMSLESLILEDFPSLVEIDRSIGKLQQLICLQIKCCPLLTELPREIGCLTALRELLLIQCFSVCYLPDSIGCLRHLSRLVMDDTGLVELPDTIKGLVDLEHLCLANCRSLNSLSDAVGELKSLTHLDLSGTTIGELPPSLWNIQVLTLRINDSKIETQVMRYRPLMQDLEDRSDLEVRINDSKIETQVMRYRPLMQDLEDRSDLEVLEPDGPFKSAKFSVSLPSYPMDILSQEWRKIVAPGFHEHHLSGRCPPKILASVIFPHGDDSLINIAAEVPLWDTGIMGSFQRIHYFKNVILMFVSWLERKWVSKWMHDFQRQDEELLTLEFCDRCMSITSVIREFSDSPSLNSFHRFAQISISVSMTLYEPGHNDQIGCQVENLEILTKFSSPILRSANLLLQCPSSKEKLPGYIAMWDPWHEEAIQIQGSVYTGSIKSCMRQRQRKTHGGRLRAKRKRNLTWSCLHNYLDKHLLMFMVRICGCCCILSPLIKTKLDHCNVLEEACLLFDSALDVKQKTRLAREFNRVEYWLTEIINIEMPEREDYSLFGKDMYNLLLHWYRRNRRKGHHHKTFDADFFNLPNGEGHPFHWFLVSMD